MGRLAAPELAKGESFTIRWSAADLALVREAARLLVLTPTELVRTGALDLARAALDARDREAAR